MTSREPPEDAFDSRPGPTTTDAPADPSGLDHSPEPSTREHILQRVRRRLRSAPLSGNRIGRFVVIEQIGQGGMGRVYTAYDDRLDRKIAIKVLRDDDLPGETDRLRFLREGQALARLSHPNVVTVHEVGEHDGQIFLAMEYIPGQSLDAWLRTGPEWPQVLEAFVASGQGLRAAHAEGLVHRDFKPLNVMRTEDGLIKVLDFGLVRIANNTLDASSEAVTISDSHAALSPSLTREGMVMGTPAYMAPEQFRGDEADAKSDQYCFCVALWEGLVGARPFDGDDIATLVQGRLAGPPPWPENAPHVPRTIVEALRRGLSVDQDDRWSSMEDLLAAIDWDPRRQRERQRLGLVMIGALAVGGAAVAMWPRQPAPLQCSGAQKQLEGIWDDARRSEVEAAILGVGSPYASEVWSRTRQGLTSYADAWTSMHTEACEATTVRGEQSTRVLDLRMACLRRELQDLRATVDTLADADAKVVERAHDLVAGLPPLSRCKDDEALAAEVELPRPEHADAVEAARQHLARVRSLVNAGRYDAALSAVDAAEDALDGVDYGPVLTELFHARGRVHQSRQEFDVARRALSEAVRVGSQWGQRSLTADSAINLMSIIGHRSGQPDKALMLQPLVLGLTEGDPRLEADYRSVHGNVLLQQGKVEEAEAEIRAAIELRERTLGPDHPKSISTRNSLGNALKQQARYEEASVEFQRALEAQQRALGTNHVAIGNMKGNFVYLLAQQGKLEQALEQARESLAVLEDALGPDHPNLANAHNSLGNVLNRMGKDQEAESHFRTASKMWEEAFGPKSLHALTARGNLANLLRSRNELPEAEAEFRAMVASGRETMPDYHHFIVKARWNLSMVLEEQSRYDEALVVLDEVLDSEDSLEPPKRARMREQIANIHRAKGDLDRAIQERRIALAVRLEAVEPDLPTIATARLELAELLLDSDQLVEALPLAEQAWDVHGQDETSPANRGRSALVLATLLWGARGSGRDRPRARTLAQDALDSYRANEAELGPEVLRARTWLAEHPAP